MAENKTSIVIDAVDKTKAGIDAVKGNLNGLSSAASTLNTSLAALAPLIGAATFTAMVKGAIDTADAFNDLSKQTGIAVEQIGAWKLAAEQSGTSIETISKALGKLSINLSGNGEDLKKLGITAKSPNEAFIQLAGVLAKTTDENKRNELSNKLLGKSYIELKPLLAEGEAGLRRMLDEGQRFNKVTPEMAAMADKFNDNLSTLKFAATGLGFEIAKTLLPSLTEISNTMLEAAKSGGILKAAIWGWGEAWKQLIWGPEEVVRANRMKQLVGELASLERQINGEADISGKHSRFSGIWMGEADAKKQALEKATELMLLSQQTQKALNQNKSQPSTSSATDDAVGRFLSSGNTLKDQADKLAKIQQDFRHEDMQGFAKDAAEKAEIERRDSLAWFQYRSRLNEDSLAERRKAIADEREAQLKALQDEQEATQRAAKEAADAYRREFQRISDNLSRSITDALFRGFENGKSILQNFKDVLINAFKTLVLQPQIEMVVKASGIVGLFTGGNALAAGETGGMPGNIGGIGQIGASLMQGFDRMNLGLVEGIAKFGTVLRDFGMDKLGMLIENNSTMLGNISPFIPSVISLFKGDLKGALFSGAGAGIGTALAGPIGGAIGSFLGSALGGMFGGHVSRPKYYANTNVSASGNSLIDAYGNSDAGSSRAAIDAGAGIGATIAAYTKALSGSIIKEFTVGSTYQQKYNLFAFSIGKTIQKNAVGADFQFNASDKNLSQAAGIQAFFLAVKRGFVDLTDYQESVIKRTKTTIYNAKANLSNLDYISAAYKSLNGFPPIFDAIRDSIEKFTNLSKSSTQALKDRIAGTNTFIELFYSDAEKQGIKLTQLSNQFAALGVAMPTSSDAFKKLVEGVDTSTKAGLSLYDSLIALAPAMADYNKALEAQRGLFEVNADLFSNVVDYASAKARISAGQQVRIPSYDVGTSYVPSDGLAMIHQGERIIPAADNAALINQLNSGGSSSQLASRIDALIAEIRKLANNNSSENVATNQKLIGIAKEIQQMNRDGVIVREVNADGATQVVPVRIVA